LLAAITLYAVNLPPTQLESRLMIAKMTALVSGLGEKASEYFAKSYPDRSKAALLQKSPAMVAKNVREELQPYADAVTKNKNFLGKLRVDGLLAVVAVTSSLLEITERHKKEKPDDPRAVWQTISQLLIASDEIATFRAMATEGQLFKTLLPKLKAIEALPKGMVVNNLKPMQLAMVRSLGGWGTVAGGSILVVMSVMDVVQAIANRKWDLMAAYFPFIGGQLSIIAGSYIGAQATELPTVWLLRGVFLFWGGTIVTILSAIVIEMLKVEKWKEWLLSEPFRKTINSEELGEPFGSQEAMELKLNDAFEKISGG
jgi:hypothetical protein